MNRPGLVTHPPEVEYPSGDGQPMAETAIHVRAILMLFAMLDFFFRRRDDVYVTSDIFLYYEENNPAARRAPDVMVAFGVPKLPERRSFFTWREGVVPQVLFEFSSKSTVQDDLGPKRVLYESLGVQEYFLFDPTGDSLTPRLQGFRKVEDVFEALELDTGGGLTSDVMGVRLVPEELLLRVFDAVTGERMLTPLELGERIEQEQRQAERAKQRADQEKKRGDDLAAEVDRLRKLLGDQGATNGGPH